MWFVYRVPISISEMLAITMLPTFFMLAKLDDIFEEGIHHRSAQQVLQKQLDHSFKKSRERGSLFEQVIHLEMAEPQIVNLSNSSKSPSDAFKLYESLYI